MNRAMKSFQTVLVFLQIILFTFSTCTQKVTRQSAVKQGQKWLLNQRNKDWGWGLRANAEAIFTLQLVNESWYNPKDSDSVASVKQMNIDLLAALSRKKNLDLPRWYGGKLGQYINGLIATCQKPRDFYGHDLVNLLKKHMKQYPRFYFNHMFAYSWAIIALCNANEAIPSHFQRKLINTGLHQKFSSQFGKDEASMVMIALNCLKKGHKQHKAISRTKAYIIKDWQTTWKNEFTASLALQALYVTNASDVFSSSVSPSLHNEVPRYDQVLRTFLLRALKPNGGFSNILAAFHVLPVLAKKSYLDIRKIKKKMCHKLAPVSDKWPNVTTRTTITLTIQDKTNQKNSYTELQAPINSTLLKFLKITQKLNTNFSFDGETSSFGIFVTTINGYKASTADREFWQIVKVDSDGNVTPLQKGVSSYIPREGEHIMFRLQTY